MIFCRGRGSGLSVRFRTSKTPSPRPPNRPSETSWSISKTTICVRSLWRTF